MTPPPRLLCARFPHLGLLALWRRHPELRGEPVVIVGDAPQGGSDEPGTDGRRRILAAAGAAHARGVRAGQSLLRARQLCPAAVQIPVDTPATAALHAHALAALSALSPAVELGEDEAWCDLSGRHARLPDEAAWASAIARALTIALGDQAPAVGVASTRFVAWMAAGSSAPRHVRRIRAGEEAAFLAPLPIGLLPAEPAALARLTDLGLDHIGQVAALSPVDLRRQFGPLGDAVWRSARGEDDTPLMPHRAPRTVLERVILEGPASDREILRRCAELACTRLGERLREIGVATARLELVLEAEEGVGWSGERLPPVAVGNGVELWPVVLGLLGAVEREVMAAGPHAVAALRLEADGLTTVTGRQSDLWRRGDAEYDAIALAVLRLQDRFGAASVLHPRLAIDPGDIPEQRFVWEVEPRTRARARVR